MKKHLNIYKNDVTLAFPNHKLRIQNKSSEFIERLSFNLRLEDNITIIEFEFSYVIANKALALTMSFVKNLKKRTPKKVSYSFSNLTKDSSLLNLSSNEINELINIQKFQLQEGQIVSTTPLEDQMKVYLSIIKTNLEAFINSAKIFSESN